MARYQECDCVMCPQGCIHCGREMPYMVYECDWCGDTWRYVDESDNFHYVGKHEVCLNCYEKWENEELDDEGNEIEENEDVYDGD